MASSNCPFEIVRASLQLIIRSFEKLLHERMRVLASEARRNESENVDERPAALRVETGLSRAPKGIEFHG